MESYWFIITVSICILALIKSAITILSPPTQKLPPGPISVPVIGNLLWLRNSISDLESILRRLKHRYGPLITMRIGSRPFIFVGNHSLAHTALVQNGAVFSDRPAPALTSKVLNPSQKGISSAPYGATWRIFRRNLTQEILHPARVRSYSGSRHWVLSLLVNRISKTSKTEGDFVRLIDHFQYAMFSLLVLMCFGDRLGEEQIKAIETVQRRLLIGFRRFNNLNLWGKLGKVLLRGRWKELSDLCQDQENVLLPLIRARIVAKQNRELGRGDHGGKESVVAYVDTLMDLQLPEEDNRKLQDWEMVNLCSEFLNAGTDTTSTALQWIMANLVKYPELQTKLYEEIVSVKGQPPVVVAGGSLPDMVVEEEDLQKMPYLKAVVLEGLRRHPPGHFVLPHKVSRDVDLDGYVIPKNAIVNFMVADMGWDAKVWDKPMEFKPERFLDEGVPTFDVTGSKEIKMMPFGAGRRICPASGLAMLHLEYFVANLIWYFEWTPRQGEEIDLTEKQEFTIVMKNPLCARISPRNC